MTAAVIAEAIPEIEETRDTFQDDDDGQDLVVLDPNHVRC